MGSRFGADPQEGRQPAQRVCSRPEFALLHVRTRGVWDTAIIGTSGNDILDGTPVSDIVLGLDGDDTLSGGDGNDLLNGDADAGTMTGGLGNDTYYVDDAGDEVVETLGGGADTLYTRVNYTLAADQEIERLWVWGTVGLTLTGNGLEPRF